MIVYEIDTSGTVFDIVPLQPNYNTSGYVQRVHRPT